ncbi:armadillo-type protein [Microdochium trichocladiopsis]|uniref:Pumilio homology domain family member 3 n=1 Tax=Microdochium trichocladiopsis TaxID=1682393 RepID=A0A9P9BUQ8_9PEZI|nr:armadillo-type protein [Microdochium trichocladiopsis]KAH7037724.1 armadillo-type protein [Microdochium trichocladiopsis]
MPSNTNGDRPSQPIGSSRWQSNGIWGSGYSNGVIGGSLTAARDSNSRGSDEASPSAPSGSAQLNPQSEAVGWGSRTQIWSQPGPPSQGQSTSGTTSPSVARDNKHDAPFFPRTAAVGQNGNSLGHRTGMRGSRDLSSAFGSSADDTRSAALYGPSNSSPFYRRNSGDASFPTLGSTRQGNLASRSTDADVQLATASYNDNGSYPFTSNNSRSAIPSGLQPAARSMGGGFRSDVNEKELKETFNRALTLEDSSNTSSLANGVSQPFQFNPGSQPWQNDPQNGQRDTFGDFGGSYFPSQRGSSGRGSASGSPFAPHMNSPRHFNGPASSRQDSWNRSNSRVPQDFERPQLGGQYPPQSAYYPSPYYPQQYGNPFDPYMANPNYRAQLASSGYHVPVAPYLSGVPPPFRPSRDMDSGRGVRSLLLEEFRGAGKPNKRYELKDIQGYVVEFSGDQHGSRFIQEKLQTANSDEKEMVFKEIEPNALQLMKDVFGNYVIQKFFEHGNQVQKKILASQMKGKVPELSTQMYACRVVQKALEHVLVEQQAEIVDELKPKIMQVIKDQNGNHVVQMVIKLVPRLCIPFILDSFRGQVDQLSAHNYGCRVVQRMLEYGTDEERKELMDELHAHANVLITDQFGNYVTQHIIAQGNPEDRNKMITLVIDNLVALCKHKFASNVVEKCIEHGTTEERQTIMRQLLAIGPDGTSLLQSMIRDQFGNYVIQRLLECVDGPERESFIKEVSIQCANLKKSGNCRPLTAIEKLLENAQVPFSTDEPAKPSTPGPQGEASTAAETPSLTTEENSPQSSGPPSTRSSTVDASVHGALKNLSPEGAPRELAVQAVEP